MLNLKMFVPDLEILSLFLHKKRLWKVGEMAAW